MKPPTSQAGRGAIAAIGARAGQLCRRLAWLSLVAALLACSAPGLWPARSTSTAAGVGAGSPAGSPAAPSLTATRAAPAVTAAPAQPSVEPVGTAGPVYTPVFEPAACAFNVPAGQNPTCGDLLVPENRANPVRTIRLHVAVFHSRAAADPNSPPPAPVVYLSGGPGNGGLDLAGYLFQIGLGEVLATRDLILFDQRGTGYSQPRLDCPERQALAAELLARGLSAPENEAAVAQAFAACRERLVGAGIDLNAYSSAASAADVADLAQALGYPAIDLYAVSYGTRLALTVLRDRPGLVRRAVLDSTLPPQVNLYSRLAANAERAFNAFFADYQDQYPTLRDDFYVLVARLNENPGVLRVVTNDRLAVEVRVDGGLLIDVLFVGLYNPAVTARMPALIYAAANGDFEPLRGRVALYFDEGTALGMQMAVQCNEEIPFVGESELAANAAGLQPQVAAFYTATMQALFAGCAGWLPAAPDPRENQPVTSDTPVLILAGSGDPITPPDWGRLALATLPNGRFFEFAGQGHWVTRSSGEALRMALDFWGQ